MIDDENVSPKHAQVRRDAMDDPRLYSSEVGRVGPVAVMDPGLMAPVLGHLLRAVRPRGAFAIWTPGAAGEAVRMLLDAGLRLEPFPILMCWDRPLTDWTRYLPISPGLL